MSTERTRIVIKDLCRIISGSVSKAQEKDADGKPYVIKNGPRAGQPTVKYYIGIAIPKKGEQHWAYTDWGRQIWDIGNKAFPNIAQGPNFAWKIDDGDSTVPNLKGKKPADNPNNRNCWILHASTSLPIKTCNADGTVTLPAEAIKTGFYVQIAIVVSGNSSGQKPGVYLNPEVVALQGGNDADVIVQGVDAATLGFGGVALPTGVSAPASMLTGGPAAPGVGGPGPLAPPPGMPGTGLPPPPVPGVNPAILQPPVAAPPAAAAPPVAGSPGPSAPSTLPVGPQMTALAKGTSYASFIAAGWTDALLRQHGMMV